ncbi:MAG: DUF11 domain-containing protein [Aquihabitans sp.]
MAEQLWARSTRGWRRWAVAGAVVGLVGSGALAASPAGAADPSADLSVSVTHTPSTAVAPSEITFTVTAANAGPDAAEGVVVGLGYQYPLDLRVVPDGCRRSSSYESLVCDLGDIAASGSESVDITLVARGSGLFTLPAAVGSDTADPVAGNNTATDSLLVKAGPSQAVRYIRGIFPMILQRNPNQATTDYWAARWRKATMGYPQKPESVPSGIINSNEYRRLRIRESYQRILGRSVDPSALSYWTTKLTSGWSYERLDTTLLSSKEFLRNGDLETYIRKTYLAVLGRQPTSAELNTWKADLASTQGTGWSRFPLALQRSTEGFDVIIKQRYLVSTGQPPSALSRYIWQVGLRNGQSPEKLWAQLLVSYDVLKNYPYTEDDYRELYPEDFEDAATGVPVSDVQAAIAAPVGDASAASGSGVSFGG